MKFFIITILILQAGLVDAIPDFSRVGYHYGDDAIPDVPVVKVLTAPKGNQDVAYGCGIVVRRV